MVLRLYFDRSTAVGVVRVVADGYSTDVFTKLASIGKIATRWRLVCLVRGKPHRRHLVKPLKTTAIHVEKIVNRPAVDKDVPPINPHLEVATTVSKGI